ncbi:acyltransferase [Salimicrobium flavidum]|uniref:Surface polysaccharide O-acyltransferase, integral membrane enzyme n=1 Tax=Salimicrobium flavidum TaxID=570947 RepID=A0A1N7IZA6_9BACI|nr:acyltransferase [Salimicrobium flavidum]SIS42379.1 Surface polysaccharide O-acyltransferase, integral membrane enzyme [Salimicrobium flavidum]
MQKQHIGSIYYLRLMAMLFVVLVHVTAAYSVTLGADTTSYQLYHFVNRIVRIEAGIFIMITGLVFFYNYYPKQMTAEKLKDYYRKRVFFIVVPYLVWALFYEWFAYQMDGRELIFGEVVQRVLTGASFYQLYFIFLIVQFYIFLPLFVYLTQKIGWFRKYLWLVGVLIEIGYHYLNAEYGLTSTVLFLKSLGTFFLGGWLGIYFSRETAKRKAPSTMYWGIGTLILGTVLALYHYYVYTTGQISFAFDPYKIVDAAYLMVGGYFFFRVMETAYEKGKGMPNEIVRNVALYSFGFYLVHPFILRLVSLYIPVYNNYSFHVQVAARYIVVVALCYLFIFTIHKLSPRIASLMFGKLPDKAVFLKERQK